MSSATGRPEVSKATVDVVVVVGGVDSGAADGVAEWVADRCGSSS